MMQQHVAMWFGIELLHVLIVLEGRPRGQRLALKRAKTGRVFFFSSGRRHTRYIGDWSSDVCSSDLGPKPARALRELGLKPDLPAQPPTTAGIIASLAGQALEGRRVGVQLYGTEPNRPLREFLERAGAIVLTVAPYVYADAADDAAVQGLLARLTAGEVDAIAFTSTPQVERLFAVAPAATVSAALSHTLVAAVGPVVAEALVRHGIQARLMPEAS